MIVANEHVKYPPVKLTDPAPYGYVHLSAKVERPNMLGLMSGGKRELLDRLKSLSKALEQDLRVGEATVFSAVLIPPGNKAAAKLRVSGSNTRNADFDVAVLVQTKDPAAALSLQEAPAFVEMRELLRRRASYIHVVAASNARRIGPVDHRRPGIFLFNYFHGPNLEDTLGIWEYTAGWFTTTTGLDNSTLLLPLDGQDSQYLVVNHCRWNRLRNILPHLIFRPSFRKYVEANFDANGVIPMPILYRLA